MCAKTIMLLWLAAMAACCQGDTITIGDKEYTKTALVNDGAMGHIVVTNGHVLYRNYGLHVVNLNSLESIEVEGSKWSILVQNFAMDDTGAVWMATLDGLYKLESINSYVSYVTGKGLGLWCVGIDSNNTVYVSDSRSEEVYVVRDTRSLHKIPGIKANGIAISNNGDVYYIKGTYNEFVTSYFVSKKKGMQATEVTKITMPKSTPAKIVELDKKSDTLYIISDSDHLFYVPSGGTAAVQVDGIKNTGAIGTDDQGNIYLGTNRVIYKLSPVPTKSENIL